VPSKWDVALAERGVATSVTGVTERETTGVRVRPGVKVSVGAGDAAVLTRGSVVAGPWLLTTEEFGLVKLSGHTRKIATASAIRPNTLHVTR